MPDMTTSTTLVPPASPRPTSVASSGKLSRKSSMKEGVKKGVNSIVVGLRNSVRRVRSASLSAAPGVTTVKFAQGPSDAADAYEAIFPAGTAPKANSPADIRIKLTLGRLTAAAEAINSAGQLYINVHGACVLPDGCRLEDAGLKEIIDHLLKGDPHLDVLEELPPPSPPPKAKAPTPPPVVPKVEPAHRKQARACIFRAEKSLRLMNAAPKGPQWAMHVGNAGIEINLALSCLKGDNSREAKQLRRQASICRVNYIASNTETLRVNMVLYQEAVGICSRLLKDDVNDVAAHMALARLHCADGDHNRALYGYIDALQAYQQRSFPSDAPATLDDLPFYDDAPIVIYSSIKWLLPESAPERTRQGLDAHIERARATQRERYAAACRTERMRNDPPVANGARLRGPMGGSAKNPRPQRGGPSQIYVVEAPANVAVGRNALQQTIEAVHQQTVAEGFLDKTSRNDEVWGFNRLVIRHDGITVEDFDGRSCTRPATESEFYLAEVCQRLAPGVSIAVVPETQGMRSESAGTYVKYTHAWEQETSRINVNGNVYTLAVGSRAVPDSNDQRRLASVAVNVIGHARALAGGFSYDGLRFAKASVSAEGVQIAPQFGDARATPDVRRKTRAYIARWLPNGVDWKDVVYLYERVKQSTVLPVETITQDNVSDALRGELVGAQDAVAKVAALLPDGTLTITEPEKALGQPKPFNKSGYKLWQPEGKLRLINEELYLRELGQLAGWGNQFEAQLLRDLGLNVRIWQPEKVQLASGHVMEKPWRSGHTTTLEMQEDDEVLKADDGKPVINVLRIGGSHYVTLTDLENDPDNWRRATAKTSVDNPGGGDCFFYSVLNGVLNSKRTESLPESVRTTLGSKKSANAKAVKALREELQKLIVRKLEESAEFEKDLYSHLHPEDGFQF